MPRLAHSPKTIETLQQMGCDTTGWALPPVEWKTERRAVPTPVTCPTCTGRGQIGAPDQGPLAVQPCPLCPRRRHWAHLGSGKITHLVERDVEVAYLQWPEGTRFDSRFGVGCRCALCNKPIRCAVPALALDATGQPHGLWVGEDCAKTLLGVAFEGTPMAVARAHADARGSSEKADRQAAALWREIKPKTVPKPVKPILTTTIDPQALYAMLVDAYGEDAFPSHAAKRTYTFEQTRTKASFVVLLESPQTFRTHLEVLQTLTGGLTIRETYSDQKPFVKDKTATDAAALLRTAIPAIADRLGLSYRVPSA